MGFAPEAISPKAASAEQKLFQIHQSFLSMLRGWVAKLKGEGAF